MRPRIASILIFLGIAALSFADRNVTVDDNDAAVRYSNGWSLSLQSHPLNFGGFHHLTNSKDARATFTFTGVSSVIFSVDLTHGSQVPPSTSSHLVGHMLSLQMSRLTIPLRFLSIFRTIKAGMWTARRRSIPLMSGE